MEGMLQAVVIVFMLFLCSLCLFAVIVIVRDIIREHGKARRAEDLAELYATIDVEKLAEHIAKASASAKIEEEEEEEPGPVILTDEPESEPTPEPAPAPVEVVAEVEQAQPAEAQDDENAVVFSRQTLTLEERYATLSTEFKRHFDDIIRHAMAKEGVKELKYSNYYDYKIGSYKVLRITIKRGDIVCEFQFLDRDFLNYANASNVKMSKSATSIKVTEPSAVGAVKDGIDLVCAQIAEDKEYKKNLAREKRREKRRKDREENGADSQEDKTASKEAVNA